MIIPNWPAPKNVKALSSTRQGGYSTGVYAGLNLGTHVGDDFSIVMRNRQWLAEPGADAECTDLAQSNSFYDGD